MVEVPNWPWRKKEKDPSLEDGETGTTPEGDEKKKTVESDSDPPPTDTGVQGPFSHPALAGKSEQEIADMLAVQQVTINEQRGAMETVSNQPPAAPEPEPEPVTVTSEEFFADPSGSTRTIVSDVIQKELKQIVAPLEAQLSKGFTRDAWDEADIPVAMRPMVEAVLKQRRIANPDADTIKGAYHLAVGQATVQGTPLPGMEAKSEPDPPPENNKAIPQHSPSTQPIAETEKKVEFEPLTENEARLARENDQTHEEYRAWSAIHEDEVLTVEEKS